MKKVLNVLGIALLLLSVISCGDKTLKEDELSYTMSEDGAGVIITRYKGNATELIIPETIEGYPVVGVENLVDRETATGEWMTTIWGQEVEEMVNDTITKIVFPDTVKKICSFDRFYALEYVKLPAGLEEPEIDNALFPNSKEHLRLCGFDFHFCPALKEIVIPEGITAIGNLLGCTSLEEITLPSSVREIKEMAFKDCENLKKINVPDSVTSICMTESNAYSVNEDSYIMSFYNTDLDLETQAKMKKFGYTGSF